MTIIVNKPPINLRDELQSLKRPAGQFGLQLLKSETVEDAYSVMGNNKNRLYNGGFDVWQRGTNFPADVDGIYSADRWRIGTYDSNAGYVSRQEVTDLPGVAKYCFRYGRSSGSSNENYKHMNQALETVDSAFLAGKTVTVSCYVRASSTCTSLGHPVILGITYNTYATGDTYMDYSYFANGGIILNRNNTRSGHLLTTNWRRISYTMTIPVGITQVGVYLAWGPQGTAGANDYIEVTGFQLEEGAVATPFEKRPYAQELLLCQRYFSVIVDETPVIIANGYAEAVNQFRAAIRWPTRMRVAPTLGLSGTFTVENSSLAVNSVSASLQYAGTTSGQIAFTTVSSVLSVGAIYVIRTSSSGVITLDSELQ